MIHRARHGEPTVICTPLPAMEATRWHLAPRVSPYKYACLVIQKKKRVLHYKTRLVLQKRETRVSKTQDSCFKNSRLAQQKHSLSLYQQVFREWLISPSRLEYEQKLRLKMCVAYLAFVRHLVFGGINLISFLVNSREFRQIVTRYNSLYARRVVLSNVRTLSNLT